MEKTNEAKKRSFETFGLLAGGLAHDYNNMLTAMLGGIDLILCDDIPDSAREAAEDVKATMLKAATLVKRMLSCASGAEAQPEPIDLGVAVADIVRIMRRSIPDNAAVVFKQPGPLPHVMADAAMVWQAVMNLVTNACDALGGNEGIVTISVAPLPVGPGSLDGFVSAAPLDAAAYIEISVSDTGCGIDDATRARLFEPLFTTKEHGNGLGLPSVAAAMAAFKGGIKVESEFGKGTVFRLAFPVIAGEAAPAASIAATGVASTPSEPPPSPAVGSEAAAVAAVTPSKPTVLVVDDDASILKLLKIILEKAGYAVSTASNGESGLETFHAAGGAFSLCLIDASMGAGMNGLDLCAEIRPEAPDLPLILMSAYRAKEMEGRMATSGVTTFLSKPFRSGDVLALCAKYAGR